MPDNIPAALAVPAPPWTLRGQALALLHFDWRHRVLGVRALVHYEASPVGAYDEMAVACLTRRGPSVIAMPVTSEAAVRGGKEGWGYPKTRAALHWQWRGPRVLFTANCHRWRARACGPSFPIRLRAWTAQTLNGGPVRAPFQLRGRARLAWSGKRIALSLEEFTLCVLPPSKLEQRCRK